MLFPSLRGCVFILFLGGLTVAADAQDFPFGPVAPLPPTDLAATQSSRLPPSDSLWIQPMSFSPQTGIHKNRLVVSAGLLTGWYVGQFFVERRKWWQGADTAPFHFDNKLDYALNVDKMAHFYGSELQALANARLLEWAGVRPPRAALWGSLFSLAAQTNVEIHDGYNKQWGFDVYDQIANVLGVSWFYAHERIPALRRFDVRLMYWPPTKSPINQEQDTQLFTDDYTGHTYWISMRTWDLLPERGQQFWPRFLQLSLGVTLHDWEEYPDDDAFLSTHLSVDVDWRELIPRDSWLGRTSGDILNRFHLPAPAVQLTPRPGFHLVFVGQ